MKPIEPMKPMEPMQPVESWWPAGLGQPTSVGSQDGVRYAFFPDKQLLLIEEHGKVKTFDSGRHSILGVSQESQGRSLAFTSRRGPVRIQDLKRLS